jgi:hypothetical protein
MEAGTMIDGRLFNTDDWKRAIQVWQPPGLESGVYLTGESNFKAFSRTLVADNNGILRCFGESFRPNLLKELKRSIRTILSDTPGTIRPYIAQSLRQLTYTSHLASLDSGHFAMIPNAARIGEEVWILRGASTPIVLQKQPSSHSGLPEYQIIGPCYVHGFMDGEMASGYQSD